MAWVAFDRAIKSVEGFGLEGPVDRWRRIQAAIHAEVCARGYDGARNTFTQVYGRPEVDASLLMIPRVGFLPPTDRTREGNGRSDRARPRHGRSCAPLSDRP